MAGQVIQSPRAALPAEDDLETRLFLRALEARYGVDYLSFDLASMQRKLTRCVSATGTASVSALQGLVLRDAALGAQVIRTLNRREAPAHGDLFRVMALRCALLPILRSSPWPSLWCADCFDLADLLLLLAFLKDEGLIARSRVFVTSHSEHVIEELQGPRLSSAEVERLQGLHAASGGRGDLVDCLRPASGEWMLDPALTDAMSWHVHHLATDASFGEFQAVLAQRPLEEYGPAMRDRASAVLSRSLCAFGILQMDRRYASRDVLLGETLFPVLPAYGIYRKTG